MTRNGMFAMKDAVAVCVSGPRIIMMAALLMGAALLFMQGLVPGAEAQACCQVTAVSGKSASAVDTKTKTTFEFTLTKPVSLHVGDAVYANFPKKEVSCDGKSICGTITAISPGVARTTAGTASDQSQAPAEKLEQNVMRASPPGGVENEQVDPCTIASADTLKGLLQSGIQAHFPYSVSHEGEHIKISNPSVEQVTCPHMSLKMHADVQYRQTRGLIQGETGGSMDLASPMIAEVQFAGSTLTASDLRQATAVLTNPQITSLKIDKVPSWLEPSWIRECLNGRFSDWGCTNVVQQMKFDVTKLVEQYLQQGQTLKIGATGTANMGLSPATAQIAIVPPALASANQPPASTSPKEKAPETSSPPHLAPVIARGALSSISISVISAQNPSFCSVQGKNNAATACSLWEYAPVTLAAIGTYADGTSDPFAAAKWQSKAVNSSGNPYVTISDAGGGRATIMGVSMTSELTNSGTTEGGPITITATVGSLTASLAVFVFSPVKISVGCPAACLSSAGATFLLLKPGLFLLATGLDTDTATEQSTVQFNATATMVNTCTDYEIGGQTACVYDVSNVAKYVLNGPANVATLSANGLATAQALGTVGITATFPGPSDFSPSGINSGNLIGTNLSVLPLTSINVYPAALPPVQVGQTIRFGASTNAGNWNGPECSSACGSFDLGQVVTWTSSSPAVATVSSTGVVTATGVGTTTITASTSTRTPTVKGVGFTSTFTSGIVTGSQTLTVTAP